MQAVKEKVSEIADRLTGKPTIGNAVYTIKTFKTHEGKERELQNDLRKRWDVLRREDLVRGTEPLYFLSGNGMIVEVLEWKDKHSIEAAHGHAESKVTWEHMNAIADLVPLSSIAESSHAMAHFQTLCPFTHKMMDTYAGISVRKPHQDKDKEVMSKMASHVKDLQKKGYLTDRKPMTMVSEGGHIVEVCEWKSFDAVEAAKGNEDVKHAWSELSNMADLVPMAQLPEASHHYAVLQEVVA